MRRDWTLTLAAGLAATALLSLALYGMQAEMRDQIGLWITGGGVSALLALRAAWPPENETDDDHATDQSKEANP